MNAMDLGNQTVWRAKQLIERYYSVSKKLDEITMFACFFLAACIHTVNCNDLLWLLSVRTESTDENQSSTALVEKHVELYRACVDIMEKCDYIITPYKTQHDYLNSLEIDDEDVAFILSTLGTDEFNCEELVDIVKRCKKDGEHGEIENIIRTNFENFESERKEAEDYISKEKEKLLGQLLAALKKQEQKQEQEQEQEQKQKHEQKRKRNKYKKPCVIM